MNKREQYLSKNWSRYPAMPIGEWLAGELLSVEAGALQLNIQGHVERISAAHLELAGTSESPAAILVPGDKIAVRKLSDSLELLLLSPRLTEFAGHRLSMQTAKRWRSFLKLVREYFDSESFIEVATPSLVVCPGTEPSLDPIEVRIKTPEGVLRRYLPTSPELHLKKLLAQGWSRVFEIRSTFRDGESSDHHQIEFTMMEFYRVCEPLEATKRDLENLISRMNDAGLVSGELAAAKTFTIAHLFERHFAFELTPTTTAEELKRLCDARKIDHGPTDSWNDLFHRLWLEKIEPWLATLDQPVFISDFPASQAALARIGASGWAERVELFWRGLEIANGFNELNDPDEQAARFVQDLEEKKRLGKSPVPLDEDFMRALRSGMPPASGIAVGMERLFMAAQKLERIQDLKAFPT